jgi:hypothetical protein
MEGDAYVARLEALLDRDIVLEELDLRPVPRCLSSAKRSREFLVQHAVQPSDRNFMGRLCGFIFNRFRHADRAREGKANVFDELFVDVLVALKPRITNVLLRNIPRAPRIVGDHVILTILSPKAD